jgi:hypothetical protein
LKAEYSDLYSKDPRQVETVLIEFVLKEETHHDFLQKPVPADALP